MTGARYDWPHTKAALRRLRRAWLWWRTALLHAEIRQVRRKLGRIQWENLHDGEVYEWCELALRDETR